MAKHLARQPLDKCMLQLNQHRTLGRANASLDIQGEGKASGNTDPTPSGGTVVTGRLSAESKPPNHGCAGARLCSLRVCNVEPSAVQCSTEEALQSISLRADEELDRPTIFQAEGQGHKRLAQQRRESTRSAVDRPRRRISGVRGTRTLAGLLRTEGRTPDSVALMHLDPGGGRTATTEQDEERGRHRRHRHRRTHSR